jgi:hypothetical protein
LKKLIVSFLAVVMLTGLAGSLTAAGEQNEFQAVKKAVKENPVYESGKEVKWFKLLVTDAKTNKDKVRITVPLSLVEVFVKCAENKHVRLNRQDCDIDVGELFAELKKLGPMALIEVYEENEIVKVWLE